MDLAKQSGVALAKKVGALQGAIALCGAGLSGWLAGGTAAAAALYGGLVAVMPTLYYGWRLSVQHPRASSQDRLGTLVRGEVVKLALTGLLFAAGAALFGRDFLPLILTCAACLSAYGVALAAQW